MTDFKNITLSELKHMVQCDTELFANNYFSQNLAIARNVQTSIIREQFSREPVIFPEMRMLLIRRGSASPMINLTQYDLREGDLMVVGQNGMVQLRDVSDDAKGIGLSISDDLFSLAMSSGIPKAFDGHLRQFRLHLEPEEMEYIDTIHHLIYKNTREDGHSTQVTVHLISSLLWYIDNLYSRKEDESNSGKSREQRLFSDFISLVNQYATRAHNIDFYAQRLFLSPRYMSTLVKKVSGRAAKEWIDDAITARIKIELKHSEKQVQQICYEMNFPNTAFFSKYFRRMTGMSPLEYRGKN